MSLAVVLALALAAAPAPVIAHRRVVTDDGASVALYRYLPPGGAPSGSAVLLVGEVGFGRRLFDFGGEGLARWLALRGHVVYVAELRGQGLASAGLGLGAWVSHDFPALRRALANDGIDVVDLVAHGWGGTLALAAAGRELPVRRVVALATPVVAEVPSALAERFIGGGGRFGQLATSPQGADDFEVLFIMGSAVSRQALAGLRALGARDLHPRQAAEWLTWMRTGDLPLGDGTTVASRLRDYDRPTLMLLGLADGFAGPELCAPLRERSKAHVTLRTFSRFDSADDFSHLTLLMGRAAEREVFTRIGDFVSAPEAR